MPQSLVLKLGIMIQKCIHAHKMMSLLRLSLFTTGQAEVGKWDTSSLRPSSRTSGWIQSQPTTTTLWTRKCNDVRVNAAYFPTCALEDSLNRSLHTFTLQPRKTFTYIFILSTEQGAAGLIGKDFINFILKAFKESKVLHYEIEKNFEKVMSTRKRAVKEVFFRSLE